MAAPSTRRPYTGSCHCGIIKYIVYLTLPHVPPEPMDLRDKDGRRRQVFYRCNCTTCQKAGFLHMRLPSPPDDFLLLSPLDPLRELSDYQCFERRLHWLFCRTCGVRCFTFAGEGEVLEKVVPETQAATVPAGEKVAVWSPKRGWVEEEARYLSVNAYTLDAGQEGVDLREWTEKKWVLYLECLAEGDGPAERRYERPFAGGAY
ncbi:Centromere protein V [Madurella fahalii]|uniref:Centromere protein V n=1 Tax=Madurella fahalii TaxID=1157608 RepID=A0ABQ0GIT8_9PEZI